MWLTRRCVVLLLLLLPMTGGATESPAPKEATPSPTPAARRWYYLTRMEATTLALLPRAGVGSEEGFVQVEPTLIFHARCSPRHSSLCVGRGARVRRHSCFGAARSALSLASSLESASTTHSRSAPSS